VVYQDAVTAAVTEHTAKKQHILFAEFAKTMLLHVRRHILSQGNTHCNLASHSAVSWLCQTCHPGTESPCSNTTRQTFELLQVLEAGDEQFSTPAFTAAAAAAAAGLLLLLLLLLCGVQLRLHQFNGVART
jgi:hypothetical protein